MLLKVRKVEILASTKPSILVDIKWVQATVYKINFSRAYFGANNVLLDSCFDINPPKGTK